jgi:hypothetical protein
MTALAGLVHSLAALLKPISTNTDWLAEWINAAPVRKTYRTCTPPPADSTTDQ